MKDLRDALLVARNTNGRMVRRPLSPFMIPTAYRPQLTSVLSISNRVTGVALGAGCLFAAWWILAIAGSATAWAAVRNFTVSPIGLLLLFGWSMALVYHTLGGVRHLFWDAGRGFDLPTVHASGWATVIGTVVLTAALWAIGIALFR
jgi:succinate dehydrogenase / fumarate reductase cytochrome b subunit